MQSEFGVGMKNAEELRLNRGGWQVWNSIVSILITILRKLHYIIFHFHDWGSRQLFFHTESKQPFFPLFQKPNPTPFFIKFSKLSN